MAKEKPVLPELTVNGEAIPDHFKHAIPYKATDQGKAEHINDPKPMVEFVSDPLDKTIQARHDALAGGTPTWAAPNPMGDLAKQHVGPGMSPKFLSPRKCATEGTRGYEMVKDEKGAVVVLGTLMLGQMPTEKVAQRNEHYREIGRKAQAEALDNFHEQQEQMMRTSNLRSTRSRQGTEGDVGLVSETGNEHF